MEDGNLLREIQEDYKNPKKKKRKTKADKEQEKRENIKRIKRKILIGLVITIIGLIGVAIAAEWYADWRAEHQYQSPVVFRELIVEIEKPTIEEAIEHNDIRELTKEEIIAKSRHPKEIDTIWELESGKGTNENPQALHNYCKSKGETNEFGFGGMQSMICFKTFQESVDRVSQWLDIREAQMYCEYATGTRTTDCSYMDKVNISRL